MRGCAAARANDCRLRLWFSLVNTRRAICQPGASPRRRGSVRSQEAAVDLQEGRVLPASKEWNGLSERKPPEVDIPA